MQRTTTLIVFLSLFALPAIALAQWGHISGRVIYSGKAPAPKPILVTKDKDVCGKFKLVDESLVVGKEGGLKNVAVFVYSDVEKIHPDYAAKAKSPVAFDNVNCRYEPRIAAVRVGQPLVIGNKDKVGHNSKIEFFNNESVNPLIPAGASVTVKLTAAERLPGTASCAIHPWMNAFVLVKDHPYMAVTDDDGKFTIENLPAGNLTLQFWHEKCGYVDTVVVGGKKEGWKKGRVDLTVKNGGTLELGDIDAVGSFE